MPRVHSTWTRDQAIAHLRANRDKIAASTRRRWERYREFKARCPQKSSALFDNVFDPVQELDTRLARAARGGALPGTLDTIASALLKAQKSRDAGRKRAKSGTRQRPEPVQAAVPVVYPTGSIQPALMQDKASTSTGSAPAPGQGQTQQPAPALPLAQGQTLTRPPDPVGKESLLTGTRPGGVGGGGSPGQGVGVGINPFTAGASLGTGANTGGAKSGSGPGPGWEKVRMGAVWVWAKKR